MTLINSQCIEVAEKVWELKPETMKEDMVTVGVAGDVIWRDMNDGSPYGGMWHLHDIVSRVNSWQGFGRTVEAMAKKGLQIGQVFHFLSLFNKLLRGLLADEHLSKDEFIEAIHLAALEAVRENK